MTGLVAAGAAAKGWLAILALTAAQGTLLALLALAITRAGRLRPAWQSAMWLVVIAKLAIPWGPAMRWSLSDLIAAFSHHAADVDLASTLPPALRPLPPAPTAWPAIGWVVLAALWAAGAAYVILRAALAHRAASRSARSLPTAPASVVMLAAELAARMRVRAPRVVIGDADAGPHVLGLVRATIVIPPALAADATLLRAALLHELAHVRRRDSLARLLQVAARALLYWWPGVRFAHRRLELAREAACDAAALSAGDVPRAAYARLLVQMSQLRLAPAAAHLAVPAALDARVAAVLGPPARTRLGLVHTLALAAWILVALGGARRAEARIETCRYTPQLGASLYAQHPEADLDGDGTLSRSEACELQAYLRDHAEEVVSKMDADSEAELATLLSEPLCCNCERAGAYSSPEDASCRSSVSVEGVQP